MYSAFGVDHGEFSKASDRRDNETVVGRRARKGAAIGGIGMGAIAGPTSYHLMRSYGGSRSLSALSAGEATARSGLRGAVVGMGVGALAGLGSKEHRENKKKAQGV